MQGIMLDNSHTKIQVYLIYVHGITYFYKHSMYIRILYLRESVFQNLYSRRLCPSICIAIYINYTLIQNLSDQSKIASDSSVFV